MLKELKETIKNYTQENYKKHVNEYKKLNALSFGEEIIQYFGIEKKNEDIAYTAVVNIKQQLRELNYITN